MSSAQDIGRIAFEDDAFRVDAALIAEGLGIEASTVQMRMREGRITSLCERGLGPDAGRYRLSFFYDRRRLRLIVDGEGKVLKRLLLDYGDRPLPASARRAGS